MLNNHLYLNTAINDLKDILNIELHARAMAKMTADAELRCEDFFTQGYAGFVGLCKKDEFDLTKLSGMRTYIQAFFFKDRAGFIKSTGMTAVQASQFLRLDSKSLFASKMKQVLSTLATALGCSGTSCSE
jgi:hypothetical protein